MMQGITLVMLDMGSASCPAPLTSTGALPSSHLRTNRPQRPQLSARQRLLLMSPRAAASVRCATATARLPSSRGGEGSCRAKNEVRRGRACCAGPRRTARCPAAPEPRALGSPPTPRAARPCPPTGTPPRPCLPASPPSPAQHSGAQLRVPRAATPA